jgi:hypothetical protein
MGWYDACRGPGGGKAVEVDVGAGPGAAWVLGGVCVVVEAGDAGRVGEAVLLVGVGLEVLQPGRVVRSSCRVDGRLDRPRVLEWE